MVAKEENDPLCEQVRHGEPQIEPQVTESLVVKCGELRAYVSCGGWWKCVVSHAFHDV
jgi:hypothetical protein